MMPSLGISEILVLAILALVVVGPKDLPLMLRKLGRFMARMRSMANEFRTGFDELARQAELDELKREVEALRRANPINDIRREISGVAAEASALDKPAYKPPPVDKPVLDKPVLDKPSGEQPAPEVKADAAQVDAAPADPPRASAGGAP